MRANWLVVFLLLSPAVGPAAAEPGEHFQGLGAAELHDGVDCPTTIHDGFVYLEVERVETGYYATLAVIGACNPILAPIHSSAGVLYRLEGDWVQGFTGRRALPYPCFYDMHIDPYGDGTRIAAFGIVDCGPTSMSFFWNAEINDLLLL